MDYALQKSVELGVSEVQPLITGRVNSYRGKEALLKKQEHWCNVVVSACEQSGRSVVPQIKPVTSLDQCLSQLAVDDQALKLVFTLNGSPLPSIAKEARSSRVYLLIGPEGGLTEAEISAAERQGFIGIKLGPRILRTETAPIVALGLLQATLGDLS